MISFRNRNEMNLKATILLGVHSKVGQNPNGYFGTGLKFAIATIMRNGGTVTIYTGKEPNVFTTERVRVRPDADDYVDVVLMNGQRVGFTTQLGKNWELWQAFRELYNNCHDEPEAMVTSTPLRPLDGHTLITVTGCPEFDAVYGRRNEFILTTEPKYVGLLANIHPGTSESIFYRGNLAAKLEKPSLFTYNLSASQTLTEDRTLKYPYLANGAIATTIVACSNEKILRQVFDADHIYFEHNLNYEDCGLDPSETFLNVVGEYRKAGKHLPKSAIRVYDKHRDDMVGDGTRIQLSQNEKDMLEEAYRIIERAIGVNVRTIPLVAVESLGASVYGLADNGRIYIARKAFDAGLPFVVGTLFEEYGHLLWHWRDETRDMQNSLVNRCASLMIELAKYKPAHADEVPF